jgi:hypothetical protein
LKQEQGVTQLPTVHTTEASNIFLSSNDKAVALLLAYEEEDKVA